MIKITSLSKIYQSKNRKRCFALNDINLTLPDTGLIFVLGKSGSGKSTLLNLIGGLDNVTRGSIEVDGNDLAKFSEKDFCNYRNTHVGFIFQDYHLIDELTVYDNVKLALDMNNRADDGAVSDALDRVGLSGLESRFPMELSGGERQRVAIARAIVKKPRIILADEPTGNLDSETATAIVNILKRLSGECLILIVSHNKDDAYTYADRIIRLSHGKTEADVSRNPDFPEGVTVDGERLLYPENHTVSDEEIDLINAELDKNEKIRLVKRNDKFTPTKTAAPPTGKLRIKKGDMSFGGTLGLSRLFLKNKWIRIVTSALMVSFVMIILCFSRTVVRFHASDIISREMKKSGMSSVFLSKVPDKEQRDMLEALYGFSSFTGEVGENDIAAFREAGYQGDIYEVYNVSFDFGQKGPLSGTNNIHYVNSIYILYSFGTIIVDENFFVEKFGEFRVLAKSEEETSGGFIITDYLADKLTNRGYKDYKDDYAALIKAYNAKTSYAPIEAIVYTGYREKYSQLISDFEAGCFENNTDLQANEQAVALMNDVYSSLGFCYSFDPDFAEAFTGNKDMHTIYTGKNVINGVTLADRNYCYVKDDLKAEIDLGNNEVIMNMDTYNLIFGTNYSENNMESFTPHSTKLQMYRYTDCLCENALIDMEIYIKAITPEKSLFIAGEDVAQAYRDNTLFKSGLYFNSTEDMDAVTKTAERLSYNQNVSVTETLGMLTRTVDVFVPIFRLITVLLAAGVIFILGTFSSKMVNDKMHEIGILKALGSKNISVACIFGIQVALIAIITCIVSGIGYYYFVDYANEILISSLSEMLPGYTVVKVDLLSFTPSVVIGNCVMVFVLSFASILIPFLKIRHIKPVKIIKAKE